jgi:hypothetical protein
MFRWFSRDKTSSTERDREALSALIDGALRPDERARLNARLQQDAALRAEHEMLLQTVRLLRSTPMAPLPRSFTLNPAVYARVQPRSLHLYPALRAATVAATLLFLVITAGTLPSGVGPRAAQAPESVAMEFAPQAANDEQVVAVETTFGLQAPEPAAEKAVAGPGADTIHVPVTRQVELAVAPESEAVARNVAGAPAESSSPTSTAAPLPTAAAVAAAPPAAEAADSGDGMLGATAGDTMTATAAAAELAQQAYAVPTGTAELISPLPATTPALRPVDTTTPKEALAPLMAEPAEPDQPVNWEPLARWATGMLALLLLGGTLLARRAGW